jgi:hypothetical protein
VILYAPINLLALDSFCSTQNAAQQSRLLQKEYSEVIFEKK